MASSRSMCLAVILAAAALVCAGARDGSVRVPELESVPVQDGGRIKPLLAFARDKLAIISGRTSYDGQNPLSTVLSMAFAPERWADAPVILVGDKKLRGLLEFDSRRVSPKELRDKRAELEEISATGDKSIFNAVNEAWGRLGAFEDLYGGLRIVPPSGNELAWSVPSAGHSGSPHGAPHGMPPGHVNITGGDSDAVAAAWGKLYAAIRENNEPAAEAAATELAGALPVSPEVSPWRIKVEMWYLHYHPSLWALILFAVSLAFYIAYGALKRPNLTRWGFAVMLAGFVMLTATLLSRSLAGGRLPLSNLYESALLATWGLMLLAAIYAWRMKAPIVGGAGSTLGAIALILIAKVPIDRSISPLVPVLRTAWLQFHVITIMLAYSALFLGFGLSVVHLVTAFKRARAGSRGAEPETAGPGLPADVTLGGHAHRIIVFGFLLLTIGIVTGSVWANLSWGRYWGWDPKEVWAAITWLIYAAYLHSYARPAWRRAASWVSVIGFAAVVFTYLGVNFLLRGLHSYA